MDWIYHRRPALCGSWAMCSLANFIQFMILEWTELDSLLPVNSCQQVYHIYVVILVKSTYYSKRGQYKYIWIKKSLHAF